MAENKKSFVLYTDQVGIFDKLTDEQAGVLIKHIFKYCNDEYPEGDFVTELAFESIKQQLKRDLKKYETRANNSRENGKLGGRPKKPKETQKTQQVNLKPKKPDTVNVTVTDNDTVNDIKNNKKETIDKFLTWFNISKKQCTGKDGKYKVLTDTDYNNLKKLKESYNNEDFKKAIPNLFKNQWAKDTGNQSPSHFLRVENFNKYLNQGGTQERRDYEW